MKFSITFSDLTHEEAINLIGGPTKATDGTKAAPQLAQVPAQVPAGATQMPGAAPPAGAAGVVDAATLARLNEMMDAFIKPPRSAADAITILTKHNVRRLRDLPASQAAQIAVDFGGAL